jgi:phosphomannomutase
MISSNNHHNDETFRGQVPGTLKFGTSGLRGLVEEMTDLEVYVNTAGFLDFLIEQQLIQVGEAVCLAGDLRPSTDSPDRSILRAVVKAVEDSGLKPRYLGRIPTPALTAYAVHHGWASIMVTGSHIPFDRNGIKFNKPSGEVLKSDESAILSSVLGVRRIQYAMPQDRSLFDDSGWFKAEHIPTLPDLEEEAGGWYLKRYRDFFPQDFLKDRRLLVYQHSAVGRDMLVTLLESFGATVIVVGRSESFVPIDTEDISAERLNQLQSFLETHTEEGKTIDALLSTDGDSDRPLICGVDGWNRLQFLNGDLLGVLVADFLQAQAVVVPISANDAVDAHFAARGIHPYKTRIGSPHVIQTMNALRAQGVDSVVGWEANGGFLTGSDIQVDGRKLSALATRDAFLPILAVLHASLGRQIPLVDLMGTLPARFGKAGLIDAFPQESSRALLKKWTPDIQGLLDWELRDGGAHLRLNDGERRPATYEENLTIAHLCEAASEYFTVEHGYGCIQRINYIDGVRFYFDNGDIAHIRPSGNAPQLRFYAVANAQDRVSAMVSHAILEPDGLLRSMEAEL